MTESFEKLRKKLKREQSSSRYQHSLNVGELAAQLGEKYGWNPERARLTGLLHDVAKEWSPRQLILFVRRTRCFVPQRELILKTSPNLLHAYVGAEICRRNKWLTNKKDLKAIASHTLGSPRMSLEDKILYIADTASFDRQFKEAEEIRHEAFKDLNKGFAMALALKIKRNLKKTKVIHPTSIEAWNNFILNK